MSRSARGGGMVGFTLLQISWLIGRPATFLVYCVLGLAGIMLTFNITLYEIVTGMRDSAARFWVTLWSAPDRERPARPARCPRRRTGGQRRQPVRAAARCRRYRADADRSPAGPRQPVQPAGRKNTAQAAGQTLAQPNPKKPHRRSLAQTHC